MKDSDSYLMESNEEAYRLDIKTDRDAVIQQARWCGIGPGARVLDGGCGAGITTSIIHELIQPDGEIIGIDYAENRIQYAQEHYGNKKGIEFRLMDLRNPLDELGKFDFVWIRFVLEYYLHGAIDIVNNVVSCLKQDGYLCLLDLDHNCLNHYPLPDKMETILYKIMDKMEKVFNFDAFVGRKLYSYMFGQKFSDIKLHLMAHHLIYGDVVSSDMFNWIKKFQMACSKSMDLFEDYPGGYEAFFDDFNDFFNNPRRFTYTPLILCKGKKPA